MSSSNFLLLASSRAPQLPLIEGTVKNNVIRFSYSYEASTLDDILVGIHRKLQGQRVTGIAILLHSLETEMFLCFAESRVISEVGVVKDTALRSFFLHLIQTHVVTESQEKRVDFLNSCLIPPVAQSIKEQLQQLLNVTIGIWKDPFGVDNKIGSFYFNVATLQQKLKGFEAVEQKLKGYEKIRTVGKGAFGTAILYRNKSADALVVIKEINMMELTAIERQMALNEVQVLSVLNHPNIVSYYRSFEQDGILMIEMEYADGGTLAQFLNRQKQQMPEHDILFMFRQIVGAIEHMHQHNILHRDLKTANVFLTKEKTVKVGDFGISKAMTTRAQAQTVLGTPYYISPEMCEGKQYDQKSDIWALGCILYEMACLQKAFQGSNLPALVNNIMRGQFQKVPEHYSPSLRQMINQLLQKEPSMRPTAAELFSTTIPKAVELLSKLEKDWYSESSLAENSYGKNPSERSVLYELKAFQSAFSMTPLPLPPRIKIKQVAVSNTHFIVLTSELGVLTWGEGSRGQLGQGDTPSWKETPTPVPGLDDRSIQFVAAGDGFSIFVSDSGMLMTCGDGSFGCLGHSDWNNLSRPKLIEKLLGTDISVVRCGARHVAVLAAGGEMFTWGQAEGGRLGLGHERDCCAPARVDIGSDLIIRDIHCGVDCTVAVTSKGSLLACGRNSYNKLGLSTRRFFPPGYQVVEKSLTFQRVRNMTSKVEKLSIGPSHTCVLTSDGTVITMGRNVERQLGHSPKLQEAGPAVVNDLEDIAITSIAAGPTYTLATSQENVIFIWGTRYTELPRASASFSSSTSNQALAASTLSGRIVEEVLTHPKELLALYASPKQIMKGNIVVLGGVSALPSTVLVLVHTTVPLVGKPEELDSKHPVPTDEQHEPDSDADSLGPIPDWMKAEVAESEAQWHGFTNSALPIDLDIA